MSNFITYLISLKKDENRRLSLSLKFPERYQQFILFDAIDGRSLSADDYYSALSTHFKFNKTLMTPGEIGCALSHVRVLEKFLMSDKKFALIIEDDVIGDDTDLEYIESLVECLDDNSILICGGQLINNLTKRLLFGEKIFGSIYRVANASKCYISGTCCYVVTRKVARHIIDHQKNMLTVADDWGVFFKDSKKFNFYFLNILEHPQDLTSSNIEEHRQSKQTSKLSFYFFVEIIPFLTRRVRAEFLRILTIFNRKWKNLL